MYTAYTVNDLNQATTSLSNLGHADGYEWRLSEKSVVFLTMYAPSQKQIKTFHRKRREEEQEEGKRKQLQ